MIYAITYCTYSMDRGCLFVDSKKKPTDQEIKATLCREMPIEYGYCGFINYHCSPIDLIQKANKADIANLKAILSQWKDGTYDC